jgi:SAM-dependent methyltransferase
MPLSLDDWHQRYSRQARWTQDLRRHLFAQAGIETARRVLEVGCGTGVILSEINDYTQGIVVGLDIDRRRLELSTRHTPNAHLTVADAQDLPYSPASFDLCLCHFLLLWVANPVRVVTEMARVTRPGGAVLALAEPDYGGRIDHPEPLEKLGRLQGSALRLQGADPLAGRRLAGIFSRAGLKAVETGVLGGQWSGPPSVEEWESEWAVLESDLKESPEALLEEAPGANLEELKRLDFEAWQRAERVLFVPTFYALGRSPG